MSLNSGMLKVNGVSIRDPSGLTYGLMDISASNAGRTEDGQMQKLRVTQKRKLTLAWNMIDRDVAHTIVQAFNNEYFNVTYYDVLNGQNETREFYSGDKSLPVQMWTVNGKIYSSVSFDIIER